MQKFIARSFIFALSLALFLPIINTKAYDITVDQQNTTISQSSLTIYNYGHNQTFTPTYDVLTSVQVYLKDRSAGGNVILTVKDDTAGETVLTRNQRMDSGTGWEVFDFTGGDSLGFVLTPGNQHSIWIETGYYSEAPVPKWVRSTTDAYGGGTRRQNSTEYADDDFAFATFGYAFEEQQQGEEGEDEDGQQDLNDPETPPDNNDSVENPNDDNQTAEDPANEQTDDATTDNDSETETDETIGIEELEANINSFDEEDEKETGLLVKVIVGLLLLLLVLVLALAILYLVYKDEMDEYFKKQLKPYFTQLFGNKNAEKKPGATDKAAV